MGKRRIRNLQNLGQKEILGFDVRNDRLEESKRKYQIQTYSDIDDAINQNPNLIIISTPPNLHLKYVQIATKNKIPFFTELNLISKDVKKIILCSQKSKTRGFPSCTFYFHPVVKKLKQLLKIISIRKLKSSPSDPARPAPRSPVKPRSEALKHSVPRWKYCSSLRRG